jgi:hypothetical protein
MDSEWYSMDKKKLLEALKTTEAGLNYKRGY